MMSQTLYNKIADEVILEIPGKWWMAFHEYVRFTGGKIDADIAQEIALRYGKALAQQALENAAKNAMFEEFTSATHGKSFRISTISITNPKNIPE